MYAWSFLYLKKFYKKNHQRLHGNIYELESDSSSFKPLNELLCGFQVEFQTIQHGTQTFHSRALHVLSVA